MLLVGFAYIAALDINTHKPKLLALLSDYSGRTFALDGDLGLKLSLVPTLTVRGLRIGNASWATAPEMVSAEQVDIQLAVLPLLRGQAVVKHLRLRGVGVWLATDKSGRGNWVIGGPATTARGPRQNTLPALELEALEFEDVSLRYEPASGEAYHLHLEQVRYAIGRVGESPQVEVAGSYADNPFEIRGTLSSLAQIRRTDQLHFDLAGLVRGVEITARGTMFDVATEPTRGRAVNGQCADTRDTRRFRFAAAFGVCRVSSERARHPRWRRDRFGRISTYGSPTLRSPGNCG